MKYTYPLLACTVVMLQASLYAQDGEAKASKEPRKDGSAEQREHFRMKMFDKNGDGKVDVQERAAADAHREEMKKKFDKNGDGKLDEAERKAMREAWEAKKGPGRPDAGPAKDKEVKKDEPKMDGCPGMKHEKKDAPGKDAPGKDAPRKERMEGHDRAGKGGRGPGPQVLKAFDKDGDGQLSKEEHSAFREARKAFDKDGDGKLSPEERKAMHDSFAK